VENRGTRVNMNKNYKTKIMIGGEWQKVKAEGCKMAMWCMW